jgi:hypothetical protein
LSDCAASMRISSVRKANIRKLSVHGSQEKPRPLRAES